MRDILTFYLEPFYDNDFVVIIYRESEKPTFPSFTERDKLFV